MKEFNLSFIVLSLSLSVAILLMAPSPAPNPASLWKNGTYGPDRGIPPSFHSEFALLWGSWFLPGLCLCFSRLPPERDCSPDSWALHCPQTHLCIRTVSMPCSLRPGSADKSSRSSLLFREEISVLVKPFTKVMKSENFKLSNYCYYLGKQ